MTDIQKIIAFFLKLFRLQNKDTITAESPKYKLIPSETTADSIYELRIRCRDGLKSRRMSIRQIGERVESKSTCYKVIYDEPLVVKIPPTPITDFKAYLKDIASQRRISLQLAPAIRCLSPSLSAILKRIPEITLGGSKTEKTLEQWYTHLLINQPRFQHYLKIGEGFVFFMELARDAFFNQVIADIHHAKSRIQEKIIESGWLFDSLISFENTYGDENDAIFFSVNQLCNGFEKKIDEAASQFDGLPSIPAYTKKEWFFAILAKTEPEINPANFPGGFPEAANRIFKALQEEGRKIIRLYRRTVRDTIQKKIFDANKTKIEGLIVNIFKLLYYLKKRCVAVRDLKPDNIFVSGNLEGAYRLLSTPQAYSLGLIDLETAVIFYEHHTKRLRQPLLAGTPSYMTPSHIFRNNVLHEVFEDEILRVLYLQDWFAAVGMIYNVTTGKTLFKKTAKLNPQIIALMKQAVKQDRSPANVLKGVSWGFWTRAEDEFYESLSLHKDKFSALRIRLSGPMIQEMKAELKQEWAVFEETIKGYDGFRGLSPESRDKIIHMPHDALVHYRIGWEKGSHGSHLSPNTQKQVIRFLKALENHKRRMNIHERLSRMLDQPLSGYDLMVFMFNRVLHAMYRQTWTRRDPPGREHMMFEENKP